MGKFLLLAIGTSGDVNPLVGIGRELKNRGHQVTVVANEHFSRLVNRAGLDFFPAGSAAQYTQLTNNPDVWHPWRGLFVYFQYVLETLPDYYSAVEKNIGTKHESTVLVAATSAFAGRIAQEKLGLPLATLSLQPYDIYSPDGDTDPGGALSLARRFLPRPLRLGLDRALFHRMDSFLAPMNQFRANLGLTPVHQILERWKFSPDLSLALWPEWFAQAQPDWPAPIKHSGFVEYDGIQTHGDASVEVGLTTEKRIVFTAGSAMRLGKDFFAAAAEAGEILGRPVYLLTQYAEQLPATLPPNVTWLPYAPFGELFSRSAAVVHHGGIGTAARALKAGVPQLVVPHGFDQFDNGRHLERLRVGTKLGRYRRGGRQLAGALEELLADPQILLAGAHCAKKMAGEVGATIAAEEIERLAK